MKPKLRARCARVVSFTVILSLFLHACGGYEDLQKLSAFTDLANPNGRQIILDRANDYLTTMMCDQAIETLTPLINSPHVTNESRLLMASAWACKGGQNFVNLIFSLINLAGADLWSPIVAANYSRDRNQSWLKLQYFRIAEAYILQTAKIPNSGDPDMRSVEANFMMIFIHLNIIATIISPLGQASPITGKKTVGGFAGIADNHEECAIQIAITQITESARFVNLPTSVSGAVTALTAACGGVCPGNKIPANCGAAEWTAGSLLLAGIDAVWSL